MKVFKKLFKKKAPVDKETEAPTPVPEPEVEAEEDQVVKEEIMTSVVAKKKLGLLPPQAYMASELAKLYEEYDVSQIDIENGNWSEEEVAKWVKYCQENDIPAVCGFAQKDAWHHALINAGLGNVTISPLAYLIAMNKYMQRTIELKQFWFTDIDPNTATNEELVAKIPENEWPFMLKNTSLSLGRGVFRCKTPEDMIEILDMYRNDQGLQAEIKNTNDVIISRMSEDEKNALGPVPPFIAEHMVDMNRGWVEYCYEGCITEEGVNTHYAFTEEVYFKDHQTLCYITPPSSYPDKYIPELEEYVGGYMNGLIERGYLRQFYNIELWATFNTEDGSPDFAFCEINPRCAHTFHYGYKFAYDTNLYRDNWDLVLDNKKPTQTPWEEWKNGNKKGVSCEILITTVDEGVVGEILDYDFVEKLENDPEMGVDLIRHIKTPEHVVTSDEALSGAGACLLQIWITTDTHAQAAKKEMEIRKAIYKVDYGWEENYPESWIELANSA